MGWSSCGVRIAAAAGSVGCCRWQRLRRLHGVSTCRASSQGFCLDDSVALGARGPQCCAVGYGATGTPGMRGLEPSLRAWRWPGWRPPLSQCCSPQLHGRFLTVDSRYSGSGIGPAAGPTARFGPRGGTPLTVRERFSERRAYDGQDRPREAVASLQAGSATAQMPAPRLGSSSRGCRLTSPAARTCSPYRVRTKPASTFSREPAFFRWAASPAGCHSRPPAN